MTLPPSPSQPMGKIVSLQWLRFVAASMVVLYHAAVYLTMMKKGAHVGFVPMWFGGVGVTLFFALSGNLMAMLMMRSDAPTFLMHRVVRIYPIYYIVVALVFLASLVSPIKPPFDWRALSLFPYGGTTYPLGVEWTLVFEIAFYVFVALLIWFRKTGSAVSFLVGWLALILLNNILRPDNPQVNVYHPFLLPFVTVNVGFAMGMLIPLVWRDRSVHPVLASVLAVTLFYVGSSLGVMQVRWCMGVGAALLVHSLTHHVPTWTQPVVDAVGDRLGGYSYAIYLCHVPVVRTLYAVWTDATPMTLFWSAVGLTFLVSALVGEVDIRLYRLLKNRVDRWSAGIRRTFAMLFLLAFAGATWLSI